MKRWFWLIAFLLVFLAGFWFSRQLKIPWFEKKSEEETQVLLEQIEEVTKLIAVEGYFSEIYDYKDYYGYDWSMFRKKALIRVKAKVSMGFDLEGLDITAMPERRTIQITALPRAKILSIDHDLDYYDITEGTFNAFTTEDLNDLNKKAKTYIEEVALQSDLVQRAENKGKEMMDMISFLIEGAGWSLEIQPLSNSAAVKN